MRGFLCNIVRTEDAEGDRRPQGIRQRVSLSDFLRVSKDNEIVNNQL